MRYLKGVASLEYNADRCTGCGRCAEGCPHQVFAIEEGAARVVDRDRCMECGECEEKCPQNVTIIDWLKKAHEALNVPVQFPR